MQVILLKDIEKLGKRGELVQVRDGFGRNFLLPRSLALPATRENQAFVEKRRLRTQDRSTQKKQEAEALAEKLQALTLRIPVATGEKEKLFGSVTAQDLAQALAEQGIPVAKKQVHLPEPIRTLGRHTVTLELGQSVKANLSVEVVKK